MEKQEIAAASRPGKLYYLRQNIVKSWVAHKVRHKKFYRVFAIVAVLLALLSRAYIKELTIDVFWQYVHVVGPLFIFLVIAWIRSFFVSGKGLKKVLGVVLSALLIAGIAWRFWVYGLNIGTILASITLVIILAFSIFLLTCKNKKLAYGSAFSVYAIVQIIFLYTNWHPAIYTAAYIKLNTEHLVKLNAIPYIPDGQDRLTPYVTVRRNNLMGVSSNENITKPKIAIDKQGNLNWNCDIIPDKDIDRFSGSVTRVKTMSATERSPQIKELSVEFEVGDNLYLAKNIYVAARRAMLNPLHFLRFIPEADNSLTTWDNSGDLVKVVNMYMYNGPLFGLLFPQKEFAGVYVVAQQKEESVLGWFKRVLAYTGQIITKDDIQNYEYLKGQNIETDSRVLFFGESMRFIKGFFAPLPWIKEDDVYIPDVSDDDDLNNQPYVSTFTGSIPQKAYLYTMFQPNSDRTSEKNGLVYIVWFPADGVGEIYYYAFQEKGAIYAGPMAVPGIITDHLKEVKFKRSGETESGIVVVEVLASPKLIKGEVVLFYRAVLVADISLQEKESRDRERQKIIRGEGGDKPDTYYIDARIGAGGSNHRVYQLRDDESIEAFWARVRASY